MNTLRNFCNEQGADRTFSVIDAQKNGNSFGGKTPNATIAIELS